MVFIILIIIIACFVFILMLETSKENNKPFSKIRSKAGLDLNVIGKTLSVEERDKIFDSYFNNKNLSRMSPDASNFVESKHQSYKKWRLKSNGRLQKRGD